MRFYLLTHKREDNKENAMLFTFASLPELLCFAIKCGYNHKNSTIINGDIVDRNTTDELVGGAY